MLHEDQYYCVQDMDLLRVWVSKTEDKIEQSETSFEFSSTVNLDDQATAQLLQLDCSICNGCLSAYFALHAISQAAS